MHDLENFRSLNPDTILNCIDALGFSCDGRCVPLNSVENRVFEIGLESGERIVTKFYRPNRWSSQSIQEEHSFLFELAESDIPVLTPWTSDKGDSLFKANGIHFAIWPLQKGRIIDEFQEQEYENLGRLLGRLHSLGKVDCFKARPKLNAQEVGLPALQYIIDKGFIENRSLQRDYELTALDLIQHYEHLLNHLEIDLQRIHGDCHKGNLIRTYDQGLVILDFDDCLTGPVMQDFWMLLPFGYSESEAIREHFFEVYSQFADWDPKNLLILEALRGIRYITYASWIAKRWDDPSFPNIFPHFGTEEYWLKETQDLKQIFKNMINSDQAFFKDSNQSMKAAEATEKVVPLTNKDFFWDM